MFKPRFSIVHDSAGYNFGMNVGRVSHVVLACSFVIWVAYGTLAGMRHWPAAVIVGLVASIGLLWFAAGCHIEVKLLDWVLLGYFVIAAIATFAVRSAAFPVYSPVVIWVLYAAVTWAPSWPVAIQCAVCEGNGAGGTLAPPCFSASQSGHQHGLGSSVRHQHCSSYDCAQSAL